MSPDWLIAFGIGFGAGFVRRLVGNAAAGLLQVCVIVGIPVWAIRDHSGKDVVLIIAAAFAGLALMLWIDQKRAIAAEASEHDAKVDRYRK